MPPLSRILLPFVLLLAGAASAAEISLWEGPGFRGRSFSASQSVPNFADVGFNDRAASVIVRNGTWQLCSEAYYRGRCVTLRPGEYGSLLAMGLENAVSSIRELGGWAGGGGGGGGGGARVVIFERPGFSGPAFEVNGPIPNFDPLGHNDWARSMVVNEGTWELCADAQYGGYCQRFGPGRYANLGSLTGQLSSMRPAGGPGGGGPGWGSGPRAILYEGPSMTGRSFVIGNQVMANLAGTGFNDRASSMRIEGGYFLFCTDADFTGECRTFGPGDYPTLPPGMNNRISSGRRIHQSYPYNASPDWNAPPQAPAPQTPDLGIGGR